MEGTTKMVSGHAAEFVREVNLSYHEEEAAAYDSRHPEIFTDELGHWSRIAEAVSTLKSALDRPIRIVDVGTGTGFVPMRLAPVLGAEDEITLTDLSPSMLARARETLEASRFSPKVSYVVAGAEALGLEPESVDVVTMNSVIHHLPFPDEVFAAIERMLRPGGLVIIAHEPNALHFHHPVVGTLDRFIRRVRSIKNDLRKKETGPDPFIDRVNARLLRAGITQEPLTSARIESIVDIHSPTAGRSVDASRGFDPREMASRCFKVYAVKRLETYRHFGKLDVKGRPLVAAAQRVIERVWPETGALFLMILEKPAAPERRP